MWEQSSWRVCLARAPCGPESKVMTPITKVCEHYGQTSCGFQKIVLCVHVDKSLCYFSCKERKIYNFPEGRNSGIETPYIIRIPRMNGIVNLGLAFRRLLAYCICLCCMTAALDCPKERWTDCITCMQWHTDWHVHSCLFQWLHLAVPKLVQK